MQIQFISNILKKAMQIQCVSNSKSNANPGYKQ